MTAPRSATPMLSVMAVASAAVTGLITAQFVVVMPAFNEIHPSYQWQPELVAVPAIAAVCCVLAAALMAARPVLGYAGGWAVASAGAMLLLASETQSSATSSVTWSLVAAGAGLALAGLLRFASGAGSGLRAALVAGLGAGLLAWPIVGLVSSDRTELFAIAAGLMLITTALAAMRDQGDLSAIDFSRVPASAVIIAAALAMTGVVYRDQIVANLLPPDQWIVLNEIAAVGFTIAVGAVFAAFAHRWGGPGVSRWVLICCGVAGPVVLGTTALPSGSSMAAAVAGLVAGAAVAYFRGVRRWDALGVVISAAGMVALALVDYRDLTGVAIGVAVVAGGAGFALASGLPGVVGRPSGPVGAALGIAALLLCAQTLGLSVVRDPLAGGVAVPAIAVVAALTAMFLIGRSAEPVAAPQDSVIDQSAA